MNLMNAGSNTGNVGSSTDDLEDRLYNLLPVIYRIRDAEQGWKLRALLRVIAEQVDVVEADIAQLYENWFIETCQEWVVPYIGDLIGYTSVHEAGQPGIVATQEGRQRNKILTPRREVANTLRARHRKGTLALLEELATSVAGWPARAVEFYRLLGLYQPANYPHVTRGHTIDLRRMSDLQRLDGPFDRMAHTVCVRRVQSHRTPGRYNIPGIGLFVWRLRAYPVTRAHAQHHDERSDVYLYNFSVLGNNSPLFTCPQPETEPTHIAGELNLPIPISRLDLARHLDHYYGVDKSLYIWIGAALRPASRSQVSRIEWRPVPVQQIVVADLSNWYYRPEPGKIAVDPELGRITFVPERPGSVRGIQVYYNYGFSADIGGGEYDRPILQPPDYTGGSLAFEDYDLADATELVTKLPGEADALTHYLRSHFSTETEALLARYDPSRPPSRELRKALAAELNRALEDSQLYSWDRFDSASFTPDALQLLGQILERLQNITGVQVKEGEGLQNSLDLIAELLRDQDMNPMLFNRLLLEAAFAADIAPLYKFYRVSDSDDNMKRINDAIEQWRKDRPQHAVIEIGNSGVYVEQIAIALHHHQSLQLRAASGTRPVIRLLDWHTDLPDSLTVTGGTGSCFVLDGVMVVGRPVQIEGDLAEVTIRHCTLVPGWELRHNCDPHRPTEPSLSLVRTAANVNIEHSIVGSIEVSEDQVRTDPISIRISDSILDSTDPEIPALYDANWQTAHAVLTIARSTVFGSVNTHAVELAENSIFNGPVQVVRSQRGCMRFCYVPSGSRTPRRYGCQPDGAAAGLAGEDRREAEMRVRTQFNSVRYGTPTYCQLAQDCAEEITRGADDESEMGVFHDLFQPQREANLRARLAEYTPAGMDAGIIFAD